MENTTTLWPFYSSEALEELGLIAARPDLGAVDKHPCVDDFEKKFSAHLGGGYAAFYNSGTSAYAAALFALDLPIRSEVIVPALTFRGTVTPLFQFGLVPVLASCDPSTGSLDANGLEYALGEKTRAIVVNHQWGRPADIENICLFARHHSLKVIEDASHAHASRLNGKPLGTFGDISFFSCGTTKLVSGGLGGIVYSAEKGIYDRAMAYGLAKHRCLEEISDSKLRDLGGVGIGVNLRGHPIAARLASDHLENIEHIIETKNNNISKFQNIVLNFLPTLQAISRPPQWTHGSWYKLPYLISNVAKKNLLLRLAKKYQIRLKNGDAGLDKQFEKAFGDNSCITSGRFELFYKNLNGYDYDNIVIFDTRDLYEAHVNWGTVQENFENLGREFSLEL